MRQLLLLVRYELAFVRVGVELLQRTATGRLGSP